jgi:hypothetical protein
MIDSCIASAVRTWRHSNANRPWADAYSRPTFRALLNEAWRRATQWLSVLH